MNQVNVLFQSLVSVFAVSMIVLAVGTLILRQLKQPIERIRCVQWTLAALALALIVRQASLLPTWRLEVIPVSSAANAAVSPETAAPPQSHIASPHETFAQPLAMSTDAASNLIMPSEITTSDSEPAVSIAPSAANDSAEASFPSIWKALQIGLIAIALLGAAWFSVLLLVGRWRLGIILRNSELASDELLSGWQEHSEAAARRTSVYVSPTTSVPLTFGVRRPVIVLPKRLAESKDFDTIAYCLSHEWAHVKSRDVATWWLVHFMQPLLWFQPLFWHLRRELRTAQDQIADNFATRRTEDRSEYASLLLRFANERINLGGNLALTMADRRSTLYRRIELLCTDLKLANVARRRVVFGTVSCLLLLAMILGALRLEPAIAAGPEEATPAQKESDDSNGSRDNNSKTDAEVTGAIGLQATPRKPKEKEAEQVAVELSYSGTILDKSNDKPIEGATVTVRRMILKSYDRKIIEESKHMTDAKGVYSFVIPPEQTAERSLYIELDVEHPDYAWKKGFGYALGMIRKNERLGEKPFFSEVKLDPAEPITGRVVGPDGKPIEGVHIQSYSKSSAEDFRDYGSFFKTMTDKDGKFRLQMVKGGPSIFWVIPENHAPQQIISGTKRGEWDDITVKEGVSIKGQVVSATGEPVPGVWVNLEDQQSQQEIQMPVASSMNRSNLTDAKGEFSLSPMKPGKYRINVGNYPREVKHNKRGRKPIELNDVFVAQTIEIGTEDADRPFIVQAKPHIEVHGQYLNSKGEPRSGHRVMFYGQLDGQWFHTDIAPDKNGKIVGKLPHGLTDVRMDAITNEHGAIQVRLKKDGPLSGGRRVDLGTLEDDITNLEIIRYTAPIVQIKPVDEDGNIIEDCMVAGVYADGNDETMQPVGGMATNVFFEKQKDGRHRSSQMIPNRKIKFTAKKDGLTPASLELEMPEGEEKEVVLVLKESDAKDDSAGLDETASEDKAKESLEYRPN